MQDIVSPIQNISYTKKDFQTIYPELLDLVKQLTKKWDPSISNESDPGVVLLKLNALIADKCNYNVDKNVLECFPLSVTQEQNARQLFEQLGYYMKWYISASTYLSLKWIGDVQQDVVYRIPEFTMVTDDEKTVVYTLTGYLPTTNTNQFDVGYMELPANGHAINVKAIQGIAVKYDINGETTIKTSHLDSNNRLYFNASNIAQNGIFITNIGDVPNYSAWIRKDNLLTEEQGNTYYKFGITNSGNNCYLEFPSDAEDLIKDGIEITYILSDGAYGNISSSQLSNFYSDLTVSTSLNSAVILNADNTKITNYFATSDGQDPETINEGYAGYKKVVGTFNTLITLRDYLNFVLTNNLCSNGFVCDRTNDIQTTYNIISNVNGINKREVVLEQYNNSDKITAFSLKLYLTKYYASISSDASFNGTFTLQSNQELLNTELYLEDLKGIQHDFTPLDTVTSTYSHFLYFKNKYPLNCVIIPQYTISDSAKLEMQNNIKRALYANLNAKELNFGDSISQEYLYKIIINSDNRIKNVMIDTLTYTTFAVYYDELGRVNETQVSGNIADSAIVESNQQELKDSISVNVNQFINQLIDTGKDPYSQLVFTYSDDWYIDEETSVTLSDYGIDIASVEPQSGDEFSVQVTRQTQFRNEILVKSILAGVTPFLVQDAEFTYRYDQTYNGYYSLITDVKSVESETTISLSNLSNQYQLKSNETIQLYAPNLLQSNVYNNYVKFECHFEDDKTVPADTYYELLPNEYIIFYWKSSSSATKYDYYAYGEGSIIKSTIDLSTNVITSTATDIYAVLITQATPKQMSSLQQQLTAEQSQQVATLTNTSNILSDNKEVANFVLNSVELDNSMYCYWVLNDNINDKYILFEASDAPQTRVLQQGEYFFYTNNSMTQLVSFGTGTELSIPATSSAWVVNALDITDVTLYGVDTFQSYWFTPNVTITAVEQQFFNINPNYIFKMSPIDSSVSTWSAEFSSSGVEITPSSLTLQDFIMQYTPSLNVPPALVPTYNFLSVTTWKVKTLCSINCSGSIEQILYSNQTVTLTKSDNTTQVLQGSDLSPIDKCYGCVFMCNRDLNMTGAAPVDVTTRNDYSTVTYASFYIYMKKISNPEYHYVFTNDTMTLTIPSGSTSVFTTLLLPEGEYIFPVQLPTITTGNLTITFDGQPLAPIYNSEYTTLEGGTLYPLRVVSLASDFTHTLLVSLSSSQTVDLNIIFNNIYKYELQDNTETLFRLIRLFDNNNKFNYVYKVDPNTEIKDPLNAESFLNLNHIYNKNVICQLDTSSNTTLKVTS